MIKKSILELNLDQEAMQMRNIKAGRSDEFYIKSGYNSISQKQAFG
jgi:hypothetical protein